MTISFREAARRWGCHWTVAKRRLNDGEVPPGLGNEGDYGPLLALLGRLRRPLPISDVADALNCAPHTVREQAKAARRDGHTINLLDGEKAVERSRDPDPSMRTHKHDFFGRHFRIGIFGDTHFGSAYEAEAALDEFYGVCRRADVGALYHVGDVTAGVNAYRGQIRELREDCTGVDGQIDRAVARLKAAQLPVYFILGNHDRKVYSDFGVDIGIRIQQAVLTSGHPHKIECVGHEHARLMVGPGVSPCVLDLIHPGGGTAYAISYRPQKIVEGYLGGDKPHVVAIGHFHKAEILPHVRNITSIQPGCFEWQTPFMRRKQIAAHVAGAIVEGWMDLIDGMPSLVRVRVEFVKFYAPRRLAAG